MPYIKKQIGITGMFHNLKHSQTLMTILTSIWINEFL